MCAEIRKRVRGDHPADQPARLPDSPSGSARQAPQRAHSSSAQRENSPTRRSPKRATRSPSAEKPKPQPPKLRGGSNPAPQRAKGRKAYAGGVTMARWGNRGGHRLACQIPPDKCPKRATRSPSAEKPKPQPPKLRGGSTQHRKGRKGAKPMRGVCRWRAGASGAGIAQPVSPSAFSANGRALAGAAPPPLLPSLRSVRSAGDGAARAKAHLQSRRADRLGASRPFNCPSARHRHTPPHRLCAPLALTACWVLPLRAFGGLGLRLLRWGFSPLRWGLLRVGEFSRWAFTRARPHWGLSG